MKRGDSLIRFISVIVFVAIVFYIGYSYYDTRINPLRTVRASTFSVTDSVETTGFVVRDETLLTGSGKSVFITAKEGERVAAGQSVAVRYYGTDAIERAEEIRALTLEEESLRALRSGKSISSGAKESVRNLAAAVASRDISGLDRLIMDVNTYITSPESGYGVTELDAEIARIEARLAELSAQAEIDTQQITSSRSGIFSSGVDGLESVGSGDLENLLPSDVERMFSGGQTVGSDVLGKLVTGITWYYVTVTEAATASRISGYSSVDVRFSKNYDNVVTMKVESVGAERDGRCAVVLSCSKYLSDVAALRELTGSIVFNTYTGVRVPKEAVHLYVESDIRSEDNPRGVPADKLGKTYIYLLMGLQSERVDITILTEEGGWYLVKDEGGALKDGAEIIVRANHLADGKVVQ